MQEQGECSTSGRSFDSLRVPSRGMARLGSTGGAVLQKSKLNLSQKVQTQEPKVDDGAGGGNNGKNIFNGGGGDNDGGDDDDYFDNFDGGDGEDGGGNFFRTVVEQLYDRKSINAVLQEWFRTLESLPAILRGSVEMGLFSSAQLVRFLSMDVRPSVARAVTRSLPPQVRLALKPTLTRCLPVQPIPACQAAARYLDHILSAWMAMLTSSEKVILYGCRMLLRSSLKPCCCTWSALAWCATGLMSDALLCSSRATL